MANSFDFVARFVPRYGWLPLIVIHDRAGDKSREIFRGEFRPTAIDALASCNHIADEVRKDEPEFDELLKRSGMPCRSCMGPVEEDRKSYAIPTCHKCLPPPKLERIQG